MHSCRCGHEASSWVDVLLKEQVSKAERAAEVFHQVQEPGGCSCSITQPISRCIQQTQCCWCCSGLHPHPRL